MSTTLAAALRPSEKSKNFSPLEGSLSQRFSQNLVCFVTYTGDSLTLTRASSEQNWSKFTTPLV